MSKKKKLKTVNAIGIDNAAVTHTVEGYEVVNFKIKKVSYESDQFTPYNFFKTKKEAKAYRKAIRFKRGQLVTFNHALYIVHSKNTGYNKTKGNFYYLVSAGRKSVTFGEAEQLNKFDAVKYVSGISVKINTN